MSEEAPLVLSVALTCAGRASLRQPDCLRLIVDDSLLAVISKSLAALDALGLAGARITLPLDTAATFTGNGRPWPMDDRKDACFVVSSLQMHVEPERLHVEVRETYDEDVLHGHVAFRDQPELSEALRQTRRGSVEESRQSLHSAQSAAEGGVPMARTPVEAGMIRLVRLQQEGRLQRGDKVETQRLGVCEVACIESSHTITVKSSDSRYFRLSGLAFGDDVRLKEMAHG